MQDWTFRQWPPLARRSCGKQLKIGREVEFQAAPPIFRESAHISIRLRTGFASEIEFEVEYCEEKTNFKMKHWNESSILALIAAVQKVEDHWGVKNWEEPGEKWKHIAAELPELQTHLELDPQEFPDVCKIEFAKICRLFNEVFTKRILKKILTYEIMTELASYSATLDHDEYFPLIGPRQFVRPIILVDIDEESSGISEMGGSPTVPIEFEEDRLNQDSSTRGVIAFEEERLNQDSRAREVTASEDDRLNQDSQTREVTASEDRLTQDLRTHEDVIPTVTTSNSEQPYYRVGFIIKLEEFHFTSKGGLVRIPKDYCHKFMARRGPVVVTCIRGEQEYQIKYLPHKCSLSGGWKQFSRSNALRPYDELVFVRLDNSSFQVIVLGKDAELEQIVDLYTLIYGM